MQADLWVEKRGFDRVDCRSSLWIFVRLRLWFTGVKKKSADQAGRICCLLEFEFIRRALGVGHMLEQSKSFGNHESWAKRKTTWWFKCTRTLNSVNMAMCLHVFLCMAVSVLTLTPKPSCSTFWEWTGTHISCSYVPQTISACQAIQTNLAFASAILHHAKSA